MFRQYFDGLFHALLYALLRYVENVTYFVECKNIIVIIIIETKITNVNTNIETSANIRNTICIFGNVSKMEEKN